MHLCRRIGITLRSSKSAYYPVEHNVALEPDNEKGKPNQLAHFFYRRFQFKCIKV